MPFALVFNPPGIIVLSIFFGYALVFFDRKLDLSTDENVEIKLEE